MPKILEFESKKEKYIFFSIIAVLIIITISIISPIVKAYVNNNLMEKTSQNTGLIMESKSPNEYYSMFQCSCCGEPIDAGCCGMAEQRKAYVDKLISEGLEEKEIVYQMVKKFGFSILMDQSKEQEVKDYIKSKASENPPEITIENPEYNFGTIKQSDGIITTLFEIKNTGKSNLIIDNMDSSCMCTSASIIQDGKEGPRFGMDMGDGKNPTDWSVTIKPGETVQLKVYYDPMAHGKQKTPEMQITREVTIISNDPINFQKTVRIDLTQKL